MKSTKAAQTSLNLLVDSLIIKNVISSDQVNKAMRKVDRGDFCSS